MTNDLALTRPTLGSVALLVVNAQRNPNTARAYGAAIDRYVRWHEQQGEPFSRRTVMAYTQTLVGTAATNLALSALRCLAREAYQNGLIDDSTCYGITMIPGVRQTGKKSGNWLTKEDLTRLLKSAEDPRDRVMLHLLTFGSLRREEVAGLECSQLAQRNGRWVLLNVQRKRNRIQTIALLDATAHRLKSFIGDREGKIFDITARQMFNRVRDLSRAVGIENLGCHDLRRTGAALLRQAGAPLEKIQKHLGHKSILTTTIYLQDVDDLANSAIDYLADNSG